MNIGGIVGIIAVRDKIVGRQADVGQSFLNIVNAVAICRVLEIGPRPTDLVMRETRLDRGRFLKACLTLRQADLLHELPGDLLAVRR